MAKSLDKGGGRHDIAFEMNTGPVIKIGVNEGIQTDKAAQPVCDRNDCSGSRLMAAIFVQEREVTENWRRTFGDSIRRLW